MNWAAINFDWNQARALLATVDEGSLSAAARVLNLTQPTLGRQVAALEEELEAARKDPTYSWPKWRKDLLDYIINTSPSKRGKQALKGDSHDGKRGTEED